MSNRKKKVLIFILLLFKRKHKLCLFVQLWNIWAMIPWWSNFRGNFALHLSTQRLKAPLGPSLLWIFLSRHCREMLYYLQQAINYHWAAKRSLVPQRLKQNSKWERNLMAAEFRQRAAAIVPAPLCVSVFFPLVREIKCASPSIPRVITVKGLISSCGRFSTSQGEPSLGF